MRLVILIAGLLFGTSANAAPLVAAAVAFFAALTAVEIILLAATTIAIASTIYGAQQAKKLGRSLSSGIPEDRFATVVTNESPHIYVYGRARVPARPVAMLTSGTNDEYKHVVCVFASHECDAFEDFYIAGKALGTLDGSGFPTTGDYTKTRTESRNVTVTGTVGSKALGFTPKSGTLKAAVLTDVLDGWQYQQELVLGTDYSWTAGTSSITVLIAQVGSIYITSDIDIVEAGIRVKFKLGTAAQTVESTTSTELGALWPSTAKLSGLTYAIFRLNLNWPEFQGGLVNIEALLRGRKILDPRSSTTYWSMNNALVMYDYLRSPICNVDVSDIPTADCITAANVCDATFGTLTDRYTFNGAINSDRDPNEILQLMTESMAGSLDATTWSMMAGSYVGPVLTLDQSDIVGSLTINPSFSDASINNGVKGRNVSSEVAYLDTEYQPYQDALYRTADGYDVYINRDFEFTDSTYRVHNLCKILTEDVRNGFTIAAEFSHKAWKLKVGQRVALNMPFFGIPADKVFRITEKRYGYLSQVFLSLKEDDSSIWDNAPAVTLDATLNTNLPNPFFVDPITGLNCTTGTAALLKTQGGSFMARIKVTWTAIATATVFNGGQIEVQWRRNGDTTWSSTVLPGDSTEAWCTNVLDLHYYKVRVRGRNPYQNVVGDWRTFYLQAVGKSAKPVNVASFGYVIKEDSVIFDWNKSVEVDYRRTALHIEAVWDDATVPLSNSPGTGFVWASPAPGTYTVLAKHEDTSGNFSTTAASVTFTVGANSTILSVRSKNEVIVRYEALVDANTGLLATATAYSISSTTYTTAHNALVTYMATLTTPVLWSNTTNYTTIVSATYLAKWSDALNAKTNLEKAIADEAKVIADAAAAIADGKVATFAQTTAPTAEGVGDLWVDTNDGNKLYRWSGSAWVAIRDTTIADALVAATNAQTTADGKIVTFYQTTAPSVGVSSVGDLWFDTNDANKLYYYNGTAWVLNADTRIATAITNAATAQGTADGKVNTWVQTTAPTAGAVGDLWVDSNDGNKLYRWSGSAWVTVRDTTIADAIADAAAAQSTADGKIVTFYQTTAPLVGVSSLGDLWFDTNDGNKLYYFNGTAWVVSADTRIGTAITDAATAQATADGKVITFIQTTAPTAQAVGDLWIDSNDGNKLYRWSGSAWVAVPVGTGAITVGAVTYVDDMTVTSDTNNFVSPFFSGILDSSYSTLLYTNNTGAAVDVEVSVTSSRKLTTPSGLSGTADCWSRIYITNLTDSLLVASTQDWLPLDIENQGASLVGRYKEASVFNVSIPNGKQYEFYSNTRISINIASTGTVSLETRSLTLRIAVIKR